MDRQLLVNCFQDTLKMCKTPALAEATEKAKQSTKVYKENFKSEVSTYDYQAKLEDSSFIAICEGTSFATAKKYVGQGKIGVLNFANPHNPGGGVVNGAMAQEECLCRSSNLYPCLLVPEAINEYYNYNKKITNNFFSDRVIFTDNVTVFKTDDTVPVLMPESEWFNVSVLTCAAPYIAKRKHTNKAALKELFKMRIRNIFEVALDNNIQILVLGAFGCGAFKNPPEIVASAFNEVIKEIYPVLQHNMKKIVFAIKSTNNNDPYSPCPNIMAFEQEFYILSVEANKLRFCDPYPLEQAIGAITMPSGRILKGGAQFNPYIEWKQSNKYFGKQFSILGDSISTLVGFNPKGYNVFYEGENSDKANVYEMKDTWWGKVIDFFGGELLVNNSWSGSRVAKLPGSGRVFPSACSDERTNGLHINGVTPDVIIVYLGTNDWAFGSLLDYTDYLGEELTPTEGAFSLAYSLMLKKLKGNYPKAEIWCCTLNSTYMSVNSRFVFPEIYNGNDIKKYNDTIRDCVRENNCNLIDLYANQLPYDSIDGTHPNVDGMGTLAVQIIRSMTDDVGASFLDCESGHDLNLISENNCNLTLICSKCGRIIKDYSDMCPEKCFKCGGAFEMTDQNGDYDFYTCKKCGNHITINPFRALYNFELKSENYISDYDRNNNEKCDPDYKYAPTDPNKTVILYDNTLKLFIASRGEGLEFKQDVVSVGKEAECDIRFDSNYISRHHARFYFENSTWFIADTDSMNGVWLNGNKLDPKTKYELSADDEIDIAHEETLVFYKTESQESDLTKEQQIENLERAICDFYKTEDKETRKYLFAIIASLLLKCPMYIPVAVDTEAMLKAIDIEHLEIGKELNLQNDVRMEILTIGVNGEEHVPIFTTKDEVDKGPDTSILNMYPCDYLPKIAAMDKDIIINAFGDNNFVISKTLLNSIILPMLNDTGSNNDSENSTDFEVREGVVIDGKYELLKLIGQSAFSKIYLAMDKRLNKAWAVKICDKKDALKSTIDAMVNEANMVKHLDHPAIPTIVDIIDTDRHLCIVEDYIEGATLENVLKEYGAQPQENVIEWAKQLCDVLGYLHSQNPPHIYRDVKPANIILKPNGKIVLVDFGIMRTYKPNNLADTVALGTKGYAAPEQYGNRQTDARTDIYGLGMTLHHLLTGVDPKTNNGQTLPICQINPNLSKGLEYIINKCIELDPDKRFQSMWELKSALDNSTNCVYASPDVLEKKPKTSLKDLFKRNKSKAVNKTVADIYNKSNPKMREMIYYGDKHSAEKILLDICHFAFNSESEEDIILSNQIYVDTWVRIKGSIAGIEQQLPSVVKERVLAKYPNYNQLVIGKSIDKSIEIILANEPTLAQQLAQYEMIKQTVNENAEKNKGIENLHIGDSDYGLVPGKPVFVNGFGEDKLYLENLYTSSGVKTTYNRTGSMSIVGIAGPVDEYQIFANGSFCCNIYLCNYGSFSSTTAPRGFTYGSYPYNKTDDDNVVTIYASPDIMNKD